VVNVVAVCSSPRADGNSRLLADALLAGAREAGNEVKLILLDDHVAAFLRDCRLCRGPDGQCTIEDGYERLLLGDILAADALIFATPLYWYGVSGQLKTFFDRMFCYISAAYPGFEDVVSRLSNKRLALLISSEESYPAASLGVVHQISEYARYTHSSLVGVVCGIANKRGEVSADPARPLDRAHDLGRRLFEAKPTDYQIDSDRSGAVWGDPPAKLEG
jgi:multimeric flavodoxin WrbA